jgi:hypothetical protein
VCAVLARIGIADRADREMHTLGSDSTASSSSFGFCGCFGHGERGLNFVLIFPVFV